MKTPDAESLAGPGSLVALPHDPGIDLRALTRLAEKCERFSPATALEDANQPQALLLDVTGLALLWGTTRQEGEMRLARQVEHWLVEERIAGRVAIAASPGLALAVARYEDAYAGSPIVVEDERATLNRLPIEALRVDEAICDQLHGLGVQTVGVLLELPRAALPARFGDRLVRRLDQLLGEALEPLASVREEPPIAASWPFENAVRSGETLAKTTGRLLQKVGEALKRQGRGALRVLVRYELENPEKNEISVALRLFRPTTSSRELHELTELRLDQIRFPSAVSAVHVLVGSTAPIDVRQRTLFEDRAGDDPHETAKLIHRLAGRVGFDRVSRVEKRRSVDPRRAYALVSATDTPPKRFGLTSQQAERLRRLPLWIFTKPKLLGEVRLNREGQPVELRTHGARRVVRCWGPERVETGWWRGRSVRRDAWWVELDDGSRLWLCQDLRSGRWSLAGEFV